MLATVSDKRLQVSAAGSTVDSYVADVVSAQDYYPFGMLQPGRSYNAGGYRYGFNGQERSSEIDSNSFTAEYWEYDSRIGRRWNRDPEPFTDVSEYAALNNNPVYYSDPLGNKGGPSLFDYFNIFNTINNFFLKKALEKPALAVQNAANTRVGQAVTKTVHDVVISADNFTAGMGRAFTFGLYKPPFKTHYNSEQANIAYLTGAAGEGVGFAITGTSTPGASPQVAGSGAVAVSGSSALNVSKFLVTNLLLFADNSQSGTESSSSSSGQARQEQGANYENWLHNEMGGRGEFTETNGKTSRQFDGAYGENNSIWYEAKSGDFFGDGFTAAKFEKFKSDMGRGLAVAQHHNAKYEVIAQKSIPEYVKQFLTKKGIGFHENVTPAQ
ncbi:RHS repeat-associated core domain-containing protein [Filimonas lacunae]|uniref:RHS repeat-associated core domain-containing protein n=1 Tax=Filimonas lacunae TaxID=477680 RepID=A0A173MF02_9BACT|nr:hypothetical protein [Filimonas lacunae]BAV06183.1 Muc19 precursor [Filimonas lacunae]SIT25144.1 RHS repeat-associated core domain-containing protein [Filimonas lacunae]